MKIVILDGHTLNPGDLSWAPLEKLGEVERFDRTPAELIFDRASGAAAVLSNKVPLRAATLQRLPALRYIGVTATGVDAIDISAARKLGITVTNVPSYGTESVAQLTIALLLELCHHAGLHSESVRAGEWTQNPDWSYTKAPLMELAGKTLGVIGFGRIGRRVAEIAHALGMSVLAATLRHDDPPLYQPFQWATLNELLAASDVVSLHCPLTPETRGIINAERLALMKPEAFILNTSRGPLIDDAALAAALNHGRIAGAGLDVLPVEPPPAGQPLYTARNCIVTPHMAWATREARARCLATAVENLAAFLGGKPQNVVAI